MHNSKEIDDTYIYIIGMFYRGIVFTKINEIIERCIEFDGGSIDSENLILLLSI